MNKENEIEIVLLMRDKFTANMLEAEKFARDTKKKLDKELVFNLKGNVAALDLALKEARKKLSAAKTRDAKWNLTIDVQKLQRELTEAKRQLNNYLNTWNANVSRLQDKFNALWWAVKNIFGSIWSWAKGAAVGAIWAIAKWVVNLWDKLEQAKISFTTMLWSAREADSLVEKLSNFAKNTPFNLTWVRETAKQLLAMSVSSKDIIPTLKALGDVSAGLNVPLERLALNYGQVITQGKLTWRELKDFTTAWVPLLDELSKNLGKSKTEIQDMISKGKISADMVIEAFRTMTSEWGRFADLMSKQSQTLSGMRSNFSDTLAGIWEKIWLILIPWLKESVDWISRIFDAPDNKFEEEIERLNWSNREMQKVLDWAKNELNQLNEKLKNGKISSSEYSLEFDRLSWIISVAEQNIAKTNVEVKEQNDLLDIATEIAGNHSKILWELEGQQNAIQAQLIDLSDKFRDGAISENEYLNKKEELIRKTQSLEKTINKENEAYSKEETVYRMLEESWMRAIDIKSTLANLKIQNGQDINNLNAEQKAANNTAMSYVAMAKAKAQASVLAAKNKLASQQKSDSSFWGYLKRWWTFSDGVYFETKMQKQLKSELKIQEEYLSSLQKMEKDQNLFIEKITSNNTSWKSNISPKTWWGSWWSKKSRTEALKKELDKQRDMEIKAVQESLLDEEEKMKRLTEIKEKYDKKKIELEGKTDDELLKEAENYMKELKKKREESYKDHKKKSDDALKDVKKYTENLDKIKKKFEEIKDKAGDTLRDIKHNMQELDDKHIKDLWTRYYEVKKQIKDNDRDNQWIQSIIDNFSKKELQERREKGTKEVNEVPLDKILEQIKLKEELLYLEKKTTKEQQEQAKLEAEKSESVKLVEKYEKEKAILEEKKKITEAFKSTETVDGKKMLRIEGDEIRYWDDQKEEYMKITDFKNEEYARDLANQQLKLEAEYKIEEKHLNDSRDLVIKHSKAVLKIWQEDTKLFKNELREREEATRAYVESIKAMMAEINQAKAASNATVNNNQVTNSNNRTTNYNITNITPKSSRFSGVGLK